VGPFLFTCVFRPRRRALFDKTRQRFRRRRRPEGVKIALRRSESILSGAQSLEQIEDTRFQEPFYIAVKA
jgi:hypothetical protein